MAAVNPKIAGGGAIGPQVVGDHPMWNEVVFLQEFAHQLQRRMLVSLGLHPHIEDFAFGADGSPQIDHAASDFQIDFIRMPDRARPWAAFISAMSSARAHLFLIPARDDPPIGSAVLQSVFGKSRAFLRLHGVAVSTPVFSGEAEMAAGGYVGEFNMSLVQATESSVATVIAAWFEGRSGRTVRLRVGEAEAEARSVNEAETFLRRATQLRAAPWAYEERCACTTFAS
jgi:hypothetical protein